MLLIAAGWQLQHPDQSVQVPRDDNLPGTSPNFRLVEASIPGSQKAFRRLRVLLDLLAMFVLGSARNGVSRPLPECDLWHVRLLLHRSDNLEAFAAGDANLNTPHLRH